MNELNILLNAITLLYYENSLSDVKTNNSREDILDLLELVNNKKSKVMLGGISDVLNDLKDLIKDYDLHPENYNKEILLSQLELILKDRPEVYKVIKRNLEKELTQSQLKRDVIIYRNKIKTFINDKKIMNAINTAAYNLNSISTSKTTLSNLAIELINKLEELTLNNKNSDPGIVNEIDIDNDNVLEVLLEKAKEQADTSGRYRSGWRKLNDMLGGGFRPGEMVMTSALQHNYKSGLIQSLFAQLPMFNTPKMNDVSKKPLNVLISFEDDAEIIANFIYRYLWYDEKRELPDLRKVTAKEMAAYIKNKLSVNGFSVKILRVNPSEWTYKDILNKVLEYEADGYEIKMLFIDYLAKLPTTGCLTTGPMGTDMRDMFNRIRNFCSAKEILVFTPHQLSTDAKQLIRNDISAETFVKVVAGKGYYEHSKQLDQVVDLELHQHIAYIKKVPYLTIQRGKRRFPEIIPEEKKYFMMKFPKGAPIPSDLNSDEPDDSPELENDFDLEL